MKITKRFLTKNNCYTNGGRINPIGIQIHTIGTGQNSSESLAEYWNSPTAGVCVHYCVDAETKGKVLQFMPENYRSWADGGFGNGNLITMELMESDFIKYYGGASYYIADNEKFKKDIKTSYETAVDLCADICKRYGWNPNTKLKNGLYLISSHDEGRLNGTSSAHVDPTHVWSKFGFSMDGFRKDVSIKLGLKSSEPVKKKYYYVQVGSYSLKSNAIGFMKRMKTKGYTTSFVKESDSKYLVITGKFTKKVNAITMQNKLKLENIFSIIKEN